MLTTIILQQYIPDKQVINDLGANEDSWSFEGGRYTVHLTALLMDGAGAAKAVIAGARMAVTYGIKQTIAQSVFEKLMLVWAACRDDRCGDGWRGWIDVSSAALPLGSDR
jgi:hypothetical protein